MKTEVPISKSIERVRDDLYRGCLQIDHTEFDYELEFGVPIAELRDLTLTDLDVIRQIILIRIKHQYRPIELANEEYQFFFSILVYFAIDFYNRHRHERIFRATDKPIDCRVPIREARVATCFLFPEVCHMLNQPKFGCRLAVD